MNDRLYKTSTIEGAYLIATAFGMNSPILPPKNKAVSEFAVKSKRRRQAAKTKNSQLKTPAVYKNNADILCQVTLRTKAGTPECVFKPVAGS